jgi:L-cysteine/cystine lyase
MTSNELTADSVERYRAILPALSNKVYMNFGAQGVMARQTMEAIQSAYAEVQRRGPLSMGAFAWLQDQLQETRKELSLEFEAPPQCFALTQSTTDGCNIVLWGTKWSAGDHLLLSDAEHPGVVAAAVQLARRLKLELSLFPAAGVSQDQVVHTLGGALKDRTRLVLLSHILWNTGDLLPVDEIVSVCHARGVKVLIDGAQSAGVLPLSLEQSQVDYYAMTGHKWLGGPEGVGALYVSTTVMDELEPTFVGWRGSILAGPTALKGWEPGAARFEVSTSPFPLLSGLRAALRLSREYGSVWARLQMILRNAQLLRDRLSAQPEIKLLGSEHPQSGLVTFSIKGASHKEVARSLEEKQIIIRTIPDPDCLRASVNWFTTESDLDALLRSLKDYIGAENLSGATVPE